MPQPLLELRIPARPVSLSEARRSLEALRDRLPESVMWDLKLLVNELVSNSIIHGGLGPEHQIEVSVEWTARRLRVQVCDSTPPERFLKPDRPEPSPTGGWGLYLLERLADRWGVEGRCVWFELDVAAG